MRFGNGERRATLTNDGICLDLKKDNVGIEPLFRARVIARRTGEEANR